VSERLTGAEFGVLVVEPVSALVVELEVVPAVPVALELSVADDEREDDEVDGLGHRFSYTNCSGSPLQVVADAALYVPFGYIQQLPEAYGELPELSGLKTT
jgi:hypothetical protein